MQIDTLKIKNYRSIKEAEIKFQKLFAFIGRNNTGKSNILKAIQVLFGEKEIKDGDFYKNQIQDIEIEAILKNIQDERYKNLEKDGVAKLKIIGKKNTENGKVESIFLLNGTECKTASSIKKKLPKLLFIPDIRNPEKEATAGSNSFMIELIKEIVDLQDKKERKEIEDKLKTIQEKNLSGLSEKISEKIKSILNDSNVNVKISSEIDLPKSISYNTNIFTPDITEMVNGVDILACGTGLQSIFILSLLETYGDIEKHTDSIFLIEEPEVYLHPDYQRKMFSVLRDIASDNQVIYTTHSPIMISDLWDNSVRLVILENGETKIKDIDIDGVIKELGIKYEDILNTKIIVFVEGDQDKILYERIVDRLLLNKKNKMDKKRIIKFIPSDSNRTINHYAYLKICTSDFVTSNPFVIIDSDGIDCDRRKDEHFYKIKDKLEKIDEKSTNKKISDFKENIKVLKKYAIESYFLNADLLSGILENISKSDLEKMIEYYEKKYKEGQKKLKDKKLTEDVFQSVFRPKNIFTNKKIKINYREYLNNKDFLDVRDRLAKECDELSDNGKSIYNIIDINHKSFAEIRNLIKEILALHL